MVPVGAVGAAGVSVVKQRERLGDLAVVRHDLLTQAAQSWVAIADWKVAINVVVSVILFDHINDVFDRALVDLQVRLLVRCRVVPTVVARHFCRLGLEIFAQVDDRNRALEVMSIATVLTIHRLANRAVPLCVQDKRLGCSWV